MCSLRCACVQMLNGNEPEKLTEKSQRQRDIAAKSPSSPTEKERDASLRGEQVWGCLQLHGGLVRGTVIFRMCAEDRLPLCL